jgi:hypothetical protein
MLLLPLLQQPLLLMHLCLPSKLSAHLSNTPRQQSK